MILQVIKNSGTCDKTGVAVRNCAIAHDVECTIRPRRQMTRIVVDTDAVVIHRDSRASFGRDLLVVEGDAIASRIRDIADCICIILDLRV